MTAHRAGPMRRRGTMSWLVQRCAWLLLVGWVSLCAGCNILGGLVGTRIEVKGKQRSLEEQVLGSYEHLGHEVYVLAGVRAVEPLSGAPMTPRPMTESEARALAARRRMEFNRDDVVEFRLLGYVTDADNGFLVPSEAEMERLRAENPRRWQLVRDVVAEENEDRLIIMQRIVDTNHQLKGEEGLAVVGRVLAAKYRQEAQAAARAQLRDGSWAVKGERQ